MKCANVFCFEDAKWVLSFKDEDETKEARVVMCDDHKQEVIDIAEEAPSVPYTVEEITDTCIQEIRDHFDMEQPPDTAMNVEDRLN